MTQDGFLNCGNTVATSFYSKSIPSSIDAMCPVLHEAIQVLVEHGWLDKDDTFHARLCLEEALVNAIKHGNQDDMDRKVRLDMAEEGEYCVIRVMDEGEGFDIDTVDLPCCEQQGGRGVCIIKYFMDHVTYEKSRNCLTMKMRRKAM